MMLNVDPILLRRKSKVIVDNINGEPKENSRLYATSLVKNLEAYGYTVTKELFDCLLQLDVDECCQFYSQLITEIKVLTGADKKYFPMYPNFPKQVMDMETSELYINALIHYWSYGTLLPAYKKEERFPLISNTNLKLLDVGSEEDLMEILVNFLNSKTSLSDQDKVDFEILLDRVKIYPESIPNKEVMAIFCCHILESDNYFNSEALRYIKTSTDLLRIITRLSGGDISLAENTKYIKLKRKYRKFIVDTLEDLCRNGRSCLEDMFRYRERWLRIFEIVHPFEYIKKSPEKYTGINYICEKLVANDKPLFFNGKVEQYFQDRDYEKVVDLLSLRPGEFGRSLDRLLREFKTLTARNYIVEKFDQKAHEISSPVLWQILQHFKTRSDSQYRVFFPKGNISKLYAINNELNKEDIEDKYINSIITSCRNGLLVQYLQKEKLGKVYIDPELKNYIIPFSQRSASSGNRVLTRGSKLHIDDSTNVIRSFIWWTNTKDDKIVDLDLSAGIYDDDLQLLKHISFTNLRSNTFKAYHSGDITNGGDFNGNGVAEFIDIDINQVAKYARYIVFQVYSYTRQSFNELNCRFGWMNKVDFDSGEIFEPKTVENVIGLSCQSTSCAPVIFDCKERKAIWCDIQFRDAFSRILGNTLENNVKQTDYMLYALTHLQKPNLYELCTLNALSRGSIVNNKDEADIIFNSVQENHKRKEKKMDPKTFEETEIETDIPVITPYDIDYIVGNLL